MFEEESYEAIIERMLNRIPDDIDKREGSIIFDALAPAAMEIAQVYYTMGIMYRLIFGKTTDGDLLDLRAADFGVFRKLATPAVRKAIFKDSDGELMNIPLNNRFTIDNLTYEAIERVSIGNYLMEAELPGESGNRPFGQLIPVESIDGLGTAELMDVLIPGQEEQMDDSLLIALEEKITKPSSSGNAFEYEKWAKEVTGVAKASIHEQWDGPNTVKVVIMNNDGRSPSPLVIANTNDYIESVRPVGAIVTVVGVTERIIGVTAKLTLQDGAGIEAAKTSVSEIITNYFKAIASVEDAVRYTAIGNALLDGEDVLDYSELEINGGTANIALASDEVPVLGTLTLTT
ncbi:baseplate J/gp47 family protein [Sporosarcina sp. CAU 1771]